MGSTAALSGVHLVEASRKPLQRLVGQLPDDPQGVVLAHPLLRAEVAEHRVLMKILSSHRENNTTHLCFYRKCSDRDFFSTLLDRIGFHDPALHAVIEAPYYAAVGVAVLRGDRFGSQAEH